MSVDAIGHGQQGLAQALLAELRASAAGLSAEGPGSGVPGTGALEARFVEQQSAAQGATPLAGADMPVPEVVQTQAAQAPAVAGTLPRAEEGTASSGPAKEGAARAPDVAGPAAAPAEPTRTEAGTPAQMLAVVQQSLTPGLALPLWLTPPAPHQPGPKGEEAPSHRRRARPRREDEEDTPPPPRPALREPAARPVPRPPEAPPPAWLPPLMAALRAAALEPPALPALHTAAQAWLQGRGVLLACPQAEDGEAAWLHVLRRSDGDCPLAGQRLPVQLQGARVPGERGWWAVRLVKTHEPGRGHQLATIASLLQPRPLAPGRASIELQLGAVRAVQPQWQHFLLRVAGAQRLWEALGAQWSWPLLLCSAPLQGEEAVA